MVIPLESAYITSVYGYQRSDGKIHRGLDMISEIGDRNVKAIMEGMVSFTGYDPNGFGNYISIIQKDGLKALYCHLESYQVQKGEKIKEGQIIGIEGTTGNSSGIHLHLEIRKNPYQTNDHINPAEFLGIKNQRGAIVFTNSMSEEARKMLDKLIQDYGEEIVYAAFKNICEKEKYKNFVPEWANAEYEAAITAGITDGSRPQALATRVETDVMIERAFEFEKFYIQLMNLSEKKGVEDVSKTANEE